MKFLKYGIGGTEILPINSEEHLISWDIRTNPSTHAGYHIDSKKNILSEEEFNTVVIEKNTSINVRYLLVQIHRYEVVYEIIMLNNDEYTVKDLLMVIYKFYNENFVSYAELKKLNDDYDCINEYCYEMKHKNKKLRYVDIIMGKIYFEHIDKVIDNARDVQYVLHLGS